MSTRKIYVKKKCYTGECYWTEEEVDASIADLINALQLGRVDVLSFSPAEIVLVDGRVLTIKKDNS